MGLKSLTLQIIPWCFHFVADSPDPPPPPPSRVLFPDGRVRVYSGPVAAAEVSASATSSSSSGDGDGGGGHLLCRSDAFVVGRRVPELAPGERLAPGKSYVLLPAHIFRSNLSFLSLAASFPSAPKRSAGAPFARPFDVEKTESGEIRVRVSDEFLDGAVRVASCADEGKPEDSSGINGGGGGRVCTTEELEKDYRQLVRSRSASAAWRPKLETIRESKERRRIRGSRSSIRSSRSSSSSVDDDDDGSGGPFGGIKKKKKKKKKKSH